MHFMEDMTHFDGKFFSTLRYLLFKPAFLSKEYLKGRRTSYLHPIRMYLFTSAVFFLIFNIFFQKKENIPEVRVPVSKEITRLEKERDELKISFAKKDSISYEEDSVENFLKFDRLTRDIGILKKDSTKRDSVPSLNLEEENLTNLGNADSIRNTLKYYDSIQNSLQPDKRDNFFMRQLKRKNYALELKYNYDHKKMGQAVLENFFHSFPKMLFVSLPLFALFLQLLHISNKQIYYVNHLVFTIHLYCATFILILAYLILNSILQSIHLKGWIIASISFLTIFFYWHKSFRYFYEQSRKKTILKYVLLFFSTFILMFLLFSAFALLSFFEM